MNGKKGRKSICLEGGKKHHRESCGGTTEKEARARRKKKGGRQGAVCDNLVEETGLCAQHCLETENIFYWEDLDWIIQVK